ncbi:glycosyltransferase family 4 protein [Telmatospirillum sp. J64-1]|uniref:glycosyltransferase family 4 protein n=1 Tax=Telmatospirillum sp. J64-1 TaxID=2502183 RepID=UPI00115E3C79|nr:glycosyltransferase family 4 protein [Telmatospirillum sp. J64-1]
MNELSGPNGAAPASGRQPVVLQVLPSLVTGGVERGTVEVAQALVEAGWTALVASSGGPMVHDLERVGGKHITLPLDSKNPLVLRKNIRRLEQVIRENGVDIIHARSRAPAWSAMAAAKATGAHFITTFHGTYNRGTWLKNHYNSVMVRGERVIAISDFIAEHALRLYGLDVRRMRVIHRGVDLAKFDPAKVSQERIIQLARAWRLPDDVKVVMLPGRLTRWKGQTVLIEALALLGRKDIRCLLVGSDQGRSGYREELTRLIGQKGLTEVVHLVDHCNDMPAAYMLTDVVVSASTDPEAFGRVIIEGQAMGRPVIATDHGGARETVIPGETGLLCKPNDLVSLAAAIAEALDYDADRRLLFAERAMAHVRENFSRQRMCDKTLAVYREVLALPEPTAGSDEAGA